MLEITMLHSISATKINNTNQQLLQEAELPPKHKQLPVCLANNCSNSNTTHTLHDKCAAEVDVVKALDCVCVCENLAYTGEFFANEPHEPPFLAPSEGPLFGIFP